MQPEALKYLYDIREAALKIRRFTAGKDEEDDCLPEYAICSFMGMRLLIPSLYGVL